MKPTITELFDFYNANGECNLEKHEVCCDTFLELRRNIFGIAQALIDTDDAKLEPITNQLKAMLSNWLTSPLKFDEGLEESIVMILGNSDSVGDKLGSDISDLYQRAVICLPILCKAKNPLRAALESKIHELNMSLESFRIYCNPRSTSYYDQLLDSEGLVLDKSSILITSLSEYRSADLFDVLVKIGPLRSRGWGAIPDAIITAPKFGRVIQYMWCGNHDEKDFGFDPVSSISIPVECEKNDSYRNASVKWRAHVFFSGVTGQDKSNTIDVFDELEYFSNRVVLNESRRCALMTLSNGEGILWSSSMRIARIDTKGPNVIDLCSPADGLEVGMFLVLPEVPNLDLGRPLGQVGNLSKVWKEKLRELYVSNYDDLMSTMSAAGIDLKAIDYAVKSWIKIDGPVIHAPQTRGNFRSLVDVLGLADNVVNTTNGKSEKFWSAAWREIRKSRSKAIQEGQIESELLDELILTVLESNSETLVPQCIDSDRFKYRIPPEFGIFGELQICRVFGVEDGYFPPSSEMKKVINIGDADQWRS